MTEPKNGHTNWNQDAETRISLTEKELVENGVLIIENQKEFQ